MKAKPRLVLFSLVLLFFLLCVSAAALPSLNGSNEEEPSNSAENTDYWGALEEILPQGVTLPGANASDVEVGAEHLLSLLLGSARGGIRGAVALLLSLGGITALGGVSTRLCDDLSSQTKPALVLLTACICALSFHACLTGLLTRTSDYLRSLMTFSEGLSPILAGVLVNGGGAGAAAASTTGLSLLLLIFEKLCVGVLSPLLGISFAFSLLGAVSPSLPLGGISKCLRGVYLTLLGVMCTVATASFSMQSILASGTDGLAMKTARYAIGNMIPIVGGTLGASLGTLGASLSVVKNGVGIGAVAVVLALAIPALVELYLCRLSVSLAGAFAKLLGFDSGEGLLLEFRSALDMLLAVTAFTTLSFLLFLAVFVKTALPCGV